MGPTEFDLMKPGAYFINTARGGLVNHEALVNSLLSGRLAGAGLDVHWPEPRPLDALSDLSNVIISPHIAGGSRTSCCRSYRRCSKMSARPKLVGPSHTAGLPRGSRTSTHQALLPVRE